MPSPLTRVPGDLVNQARDARPELAGASLPMVVRVALAYLAGLPIPAAIERGKVTAKPGPKPRLITDD